VQVLAGMRAAGSLAGSIGDASMKQQRVTFRSTSYLVFFFSSFFIKRARV
jgi:hypothetical protein